MAKSAPRKPAEEPAELIISKSRTKDAAGDLRISAEFYAALDRKVRALIAEAGERARGNGRSTLRDVDL